MEAKESNFLNMFDKLEKFLKTETVIGEQIKVGNITLIPIITVSFGLGGGEGTGTDEKGNKGLGSGGGVGCKISPNAILVIKDDDMKIFPLGSKGSLESIMEMVPEIVNNIKCGKGNENIDR